MLWKKEYFLFYNNKSLHQILDYFTPAEVHFRGDSAGRSTSSKCNKMAKLSFNVVGAKKSKFKLGQMKITGVFCSLNFMKIGLDMGLTPDGNKNRQHDLVL